MNETGEETSLLLGNIALVDSYLQYCEDRQIENAQRFIAPEVKIQFPGGKEFASLEAVFNSASSDYQWVRKRRTRFLEGKTGNDEFVISMGMLYGVDENNLPFDNIRYIDLFVLRDGLIIEQNVWNDLAKEGIGHSTKRKEKETKQ